MKKRALPVNLVVIHHSASNDVSSTFHDLINERKRRNEGYNFIIDDTGNPNDGKADAVQDVPDDEISNGVYGVNSIAWNVCVDGNFEISHPTNDEVEKLCQVIAVKCLKWGWRKKDVEKIITHRDAGMNYSKEKYITACPGKNLISRIECIRSRVKSYLPD